MTEGDPRRNEDDKAQLGLLGWGLLVGGLLAVVVGIATNGVLTGLGALAAAVGAVVLVATGRLWTVGR